MLERVLQQARQLFDLGLADAGELGAQDLLHLGDGPAVAGEPGVPDLADTQHGQAALLALIWPANAIRVTRPT